MYWLILIFPNYKLAKYAYAGSVYYENKYEHNEASFQPDFEDGHYYGFIIEKLPEERSSHRQAILDLKAMMNTLTMSARA